MHDPRRRHRQAETPGKRQAEVLVLGMAVELTWRQGDPYYRDTPSVVWVAGSRLSQPGRSFPADQQPEERLPDRARRPRASPALRDGRMGWGRPRFRVARSPSDRTSGRKSRGSRRKSRPVCISTAARGGDGAFRACGAHDGGHEPFAIADLLRPGFGSSDDLRKPLLRLTGPPSVHNGQVGWT